MFLFVAGCFVLFVLVFRCSCSSSCSCWRSVFCSVLVVLFVVWFVVGVCSCCLCICW